MAVLKFWDGSAWQYVGGPSPTLPPGTLLSVQRKLPADAGYVANFTTNQNPVPDGSGGLMQISITPTVNAWWDVAGSVGLVQKIDAAYHYLVAGLAIDKADALGDNSGSIHYQTQHSTVQTFMGYKVWRTWALAAGVTYTAFLYLNIGSGGTWRYYAGPSHLNLEGRLFSR